MHKQREWKYHYEERKKPVKIYSGLRGKLQERMHVARRQLNKENLQKAGQMTGRGLQAVGKGLQTASKYATKYQATGKRVGQGLSAFDSVFDTSSAFNLGVAPQKSSKGRKKRQKEYDVVRGWR